MAAPTPGLIAHLLFNAVAGFFPGINAACKRFSIRKPLFLIRLCLTGRGNFVVSSAVKDDLLILRYGICPGREIF